MPSINVNRVLSSPRIAAQTFLVVRRAEEIVRGRPVLSAWFLPAGGSVTPTGDNSLVREEAYSMQENSIKVVTAFRLRSVSVDALGVKFQPDIVRWNGADYLVKTLNEYTQFGPGFVEADASSFAYVGPPPQLALAAAGGLDFEWPQNSGLIP